MTAQASTTPPAGTRESAIVVAHPGHELRVFHWMEESRPLYCCITEGSGGSASSRLASTSAILQAVGAVPGPVYGRYPDKAIYRLLLDGAVDVFVQLAKELADCFEKYDVVQVAGDAVEGFNPAHDVCRFVIDGAVDMVRLRTGRILRNHDFALDSPPEACPEPLRSAATRVDLDEEALERKIAAALSYHELGEEVRLALGRFGRQAFAVEYLRPSATRLMIEQFDRELPAYERYGKMRVDEGRYDEVIRYREHVLPVRHAIEQAKRP
jgi:hypothetical protein